MFTERDPVTPLASATASIRPLRLRPATAVQLLVKPSSEACPGTTPMNVLNTSNTELSLCHPLPSGVHGTVRRPYRPYGCW